MTHSQTVLLFSHLVIIHILLIFIFLRVDILFCRHLKGINSHDGVYIKCYTLNMKITA